MKTINVRGEQRLSVLVSQRVGDALTSADAPKTLKDLLRGMNLEGVDLTRDQRPPRDIDLDLLLDTNAISELRGRTPAQPDAGFADWFDAASSRNYF